MFYSFNYFFINISILFENFETMLQVSTTSTFHSL